MSLITQNKVDIEHIKNFNLQKRQNKNRRIKWQKNVLYNMSKISQLTTVNHNITCYRDKCVLSANIWWSS